MDNRELSATVTTLLQAKGMEACDFILRALAGGGNNRVFLVQGGDAPLVAKAYFNDAADTRDRLGAEYAFLSYAVKAGLDNVPRPIACDPARHVGIYEFIDGVRLDAAQLTQEHVLAAAAFIARLNASHEHARALPVASDACFDISQYLATVDRRLDRLATLKIEDDADREAALLIGEMSTRWRRQRTDILGADATDLDPDDRIVSPSDFGFHNALLRSDGTLCFIDFEYAGWDDPAKMVGDFFCQPAVPVPQQYFDAFITAALQHSPRLEQLRQRAHLLLPATQMKWCCIMLNEFLPEAARRRQFANPTSPLEQRKRAQLEKTRQFFQSKVA